MHEEDVKRLQESIDQEHGNAIRGSVYGLTFGLVTWGIFIAGYFLLRGAR